ncbi:hypothetical protein AB0J82_33610 [Asanoa sp. NPDC049518]|uniref:hypothetical protein n=1 Tax=unclassified Asanoa TaxID=2685164 RepID=UPI003432A7AE
MRRRIMTLLTVLAVVTGLFVVVSPPASAAPLVNAKVTVNRIRAISSDDEGLCGRVDWYVKVSINGVWFNNEDTEDQDDREGIGDISPDWEFSVPNLDVATLPQRDGAAFLPVVVEAWDEDGGFCLDDNQYDVSPTGATALLADVRVAPCEASVEGEAPIACGTPIVRSGNGDDRAELTVTIAVDPPASAPGLRIACAHTPAWPQPGQTVTITATALDGSLMPTVVPTSLEIWLSPTDQQTRSGVGSFSRTLTAAGPSFTYGCRLSVGATTIFSGWRRTTVGDPTPNFTFPKPAVPILYTGGQGSRIDVVLIADRDTYTGPGPIGLNPMFQADISTVIDTGVFRFDPFLTNQDLFNFWLLPDNSGRAVDFASDDDHDLPVLWDEIFAFADVGVILHRKGAQRDFGMPDDHIASVNLVRADAMGGVRHEMGHVPFGLADEYCCDAAYFYNEVAPNVYEDLAGDEGCDADAPNLGRVRDACRALEEDGDVWFTSEPGDLTTGLMNDDVMNDNGPPNAADIRRFNLIFGDCRIAKC